MGKDDIKNCMWRGKIITIALTKDRQEQDKYNRHEK